MVSLFTFVGVVFGLVVGSFLNVVIFRYNTGRTLVKGRSECMSCQHTLQWYELIPVVSFLIQKGRCRNCSMRFSWQYPLVELITSILFGGVVFFALEGLSLWGSNLVLYVLYMWIISALLIVISVYDIHHTIIPDVFVYTFALLTCGGLFVNWSALTFVLPSFLAVSAGPLVALPFAVLWFVSRGRWMGFGDAKLTLGIGWFLGITHGFSAVLWAFWIGAAYSVCIIALQKYRAWSSLSQRSGGVTMKSEIPFGPFLVLGFLLLYFFPFLSIVYIMEIL